MTKKKDKGKGAKPKGEAVKPSTSKGGTQSAPASQQSQYPPHLPQSRIR